MQRPNHAPPVPANTGYSHQPPHRQRTPDDGYGTMDDNLGSRPDVMTSQLSNHSAQTSMRRVNDAHNLNTRYPHDSNTDLYSERSVVVPKHGHFRSRDDESVSDDGGFRQRPATMERYSAADNLSR